MATFNTVPDKSDGDPFTEAMWDDSLKTNINNLIVPPMASVYTTSQSITTSTLTVVSFATESFDTDGMATLGTNADRLTVVTTGVYLISINAEWQSTTANTQQLHVYKNGAALQIPTTSADVGQESSTGAGLIQSAATLQSLTATDYIGVGVFHSTGSSRTIAVWLQMAWMGRLS